MMPDTHEPLCLDYADERDIGARPNQEDFAMYYTATTEGEPCRELLFALADGMGGYAGGEIASSLVVRAFIRSMKNTPHTPGNEHGALLQAMTAANAALQRRKAGEAPELRNMGCTLCCAWVRGQRLHYLSVGDSLLYLMRGRRLYRLNLIHNFREDMLRAAKVGGKGAKSVLNLPEVRTHGARITSYLGGENIPQVDCPDQALTLEAGDSILVASDGLLSLPPAEIANCLKIDSPHDHTARRDVSRLLDRVLDAHAPHQDNVCVGLMRLVYEY